MLQDFFDSQKQNPEMIKEDFFEKNVNATAVLPKKIKKRRRELSEKEAECMLNDVADQIAKRVAPLFDNLPSQMMSENQQHDVRSKRSTACSDEQLQLDSPKCSSFTVNDALPEFSTQVDLTSDISGIKTSAEELIQENSSPKASGFTLFRYEAQTPEVSSTSRDTVMNFSKDMNFVSHASGISPAHESVKKDSLDEMTDYKLSNTNNETQTFEVSGTVNDAVPEMSIAVDIAPCTSVVFPVKDHSPDKMSGFEFYGNETQTFEVSSTVCDTVSNISNEVETTPHVLGISDFPDEMSGFKVSSNKTQASEVSSTKPVAVSAQKVSKKSSSKKISSKKANKVYKSGHLKRECRVKHVCRSASYVLGLPRATFAAPKKTASLCALSGKKMQKRF